MTLFLLTLVLGIPLADSVPVDLTINDAVARALTYSPTLESVRQEELARKADAKAAQTQRLPTVSVSANAIHNGELPSSSFGGMTFELGSEQEFDLTGRVDQIIFSGGRVSSEIKIAELTELSGRLLTKSQRNTVIAAAREQYAEALRAEALHKAALSSILAATAHKSDAEARVRAGLAAGVEVIRADLRLKEAVLDETTKRTRKALAISRLATLVGLSTHTPINLVDDLPETTAAPHPDPEAHALRTRPDLAATRADAFIAQERIRVARSGFMPNLSAFGSMTYENDASRPEDESWRVGLAGSWEIFNFGRTGNQVAAASHRSSASTSIVKQKEDAVRIEVRESLLAITNAEELMRTAQQRILVAEEDLRISRLRFSEGVGTGTEVVDAESALATATNSLINARADYFLAQTRLWLATGGDNGNGTSLVKR